MRSLVVENRRGLSSLVQERSMERGHAEGGEERSWE